MDQNLRPLRLSLTLPGSASLGAYQAGAVSALAETIDELRAQGRSVDVDAIGGASAGAIVSLMFAHCLTEGLDTAQVLHDAWVERVDVESLRSTDTNTPLGFERLRAELAEYLKGDGDPDRRSGEPVALHIGLTNLLGLTYPVETSYSEAHGITYVDWAQFVLVPGGGLEQLTEPEGRSPIDFVLASASHPGAFKPVAIDRSDMRAAFEDNGVTNFPDSGVLWYTDGGLVESKPIGRVVQLARERAGSAAGLRMHLVVDPRSSGPSGSSAWCDPDAQPSWLSGLRRAISILPTQALHDDLIGVAVTNKRLELIDDIVAELTPMLLAETEALTDLAARHDVSADGQSAAGYLKAILAALGGVEDKEKVDVEIISPLEVAADREEGVSQLLAGDFIGAFGGFLSREIRASDFELGWASVRSWIPGGLERHGVSDHHISCVNHRLDEHEHGQSGSFEPAETGLDALDAGARLRLARLAARVGKILVGEAVDGAVPNPFDRSKEGSK